MPELLPEVDEQDNLLAIHPKEKLKELNFRHRAALIIPKTHNHKIILAKRAKDKFPYPNVWMCAIGGKVQAHETYEQAALREMLEEGNYISQLQFVLSSPFENTEEKYIAHIFTTTDEIPLEKFQPEPGEVQYFQAFTIKETMDMIQKKTEDFGPSFRVHFQRFIEKIKTRL